LAPFPATDEYIHPPWRTACDRFQRPPQQVSIRSRWLQGDDLVRFWASPEAIAPVDGTPANAGALPRFQDGANRVAPLRLCRLVLPSCRMPGLLVMRDCVIGSFFNTLAVY